MAVAVKTDMLSGEVERYMDPDVLPNRLNWLVLRKHSRAKVRAWLKEMPKFSDDEVRAEFWPTAIGRFNLKLPDRPDLAKALKHLTTPADISPQALDAYLNVHPDALTGNAEAELCPKHSAFIQDVPRLRETLNMLLDPSVDVIRRIDYVIGGPYRLYGFGPATATTILECWNDGKDDGDHPMYSKWTGHADRALAMLGFRYRASTPGQTYANVRDDQKLLMDEFPQFRNLSDVDMFMFFLDPRGLDMAS